MVYPALLPLMCTPLLPVVDWTDASHRFKWTRPCSRKTKSGFCACAVTFQRSLHPYRADHFWRSFIHLFFEYRRLFYGEQ